MNCASKKHNREAKMDEIRVSALSVINASVTKILNAYLFKAEAVPAEVFIESFC